MFFSRAEKILLLKLMAKFFTFHGFALRKGILYMDILQQLFRSIFDKYSKNSSFFLGKRRCPGEVFAKSALFILFVGIMQKYYLLPVPGEKSIKIDFIDGLVITPKPYQMLIVPR